MTSVLEMALEALEYHREQTRAIPKSDAAIAALKEAIKTQGEPGAWLIRGWRGYEDNATDSGLTAELAKSQGATVTPLYTYTSAPTIPEGWQLVPKHPTPKMIHEGLMSRLCPVTGSESAASIYKAMLSAAPKETAMTDRVESMQLGVDEVRALRQQLAECQANLKAEVAYSNKTDVQLAESQAREKVLRDALTRASGFEAYMEDKVITEALALPSDSTALDSAIRQAVKEFAEELAAKFGIYR